MENQKDENVKTNDVVEETLKETVEENKTVEVTETLEKSNFN